METIKKNLLAVIVIIGFTMMFFAGAGSYLMNRPGTAIGEASVSVVK